MVEVGSANCLRIGVDVGGTNTDAVLLSASNAVLSSSKQSTTADVTSGVISAISSVIADANVPAPSVRALFLGTTHFVNAIIQRSPELSPVAVLRLCGPATRALPPFASTLLGDELAAAIGPPQGLFHFAQGGFEVDGATEITALDEDEIREFARRLKQENPGIQSIVVSSVFSPANPQHEERACALLREELCSDAVYWITASHEVAGLGLLERENAAILNACVQPLARRTVRALQQAMRRLELPSCELFFTQNDGTVVGTSTAERLPIRTFSSGPTNSMRGAALLSGLADALVVDIGGTSTDVGALVGSFPRQTNLEALIGGVATNFTLPDVLSIALGGGSRVDDQGRVGPESVGYRLKQKALCFGGDVVTATDVAVVLGKAAGMGDAATAAGCLSIEVAEKAWAAMQCKLADAIDQVRVSAEPVPVVLVGGGAILFDGAGGMDGVGQLIRPPHAAVANAIGAAMAQTSGTVDSVVALPAAGTAEREAVLKKAELDARALAMAEGALSASCKLVEKEEIPLAYMPGGSVRLRMRVVGDLDLTCLGRRNSRGGSELVADGADLEASSAKRPRFRYESSLTDALLLSTSSQSPPETAEAPVNGDWILNEDDIRALAIGAGILGTGGGGNPFKASAKIRQLMCASGARVRLRRPELVSAEQVVFSGGYMGAPTVGAEKVGSAELQAAGQAMTAITGLKPDLLLCREIGGGNGLELLLWAAQIGCPVVDGCIRGRAFPELQMTTSSIYGGVAMMCPGVLADEKGNVASVSAAVDAKSVERLLRASCTTMGSMAGFVSAPLRGKDLPHILLPNCYSQAWRLGQSVLRARAAHSDPVQAILESEHGRLLFCGKVVDVSRETRAGFARGRLLLRSAAAPPGETPGAAGDECRIEYQNEYLLCLVDGARVAVVPDLICVVESETGRSIGTEELRYGLRVSVIGIPCNPLLTTERALRVVGPQAFGYEGPFQSVMGEYKKPASAFPSQESSKL